MHWVVLAAVVLALSAAMIVQGYLTHLGDPLDDSRIPAGGSAAAVPSEVTDGGPVIDARGGEVRTSGPPERTIALTFDDGPDPVWTPQILSVLRKHQVHATFFVVGSEAIKHPDVLRQIVAEGHEIGIHTLTHVDLAGAPRWRQELEIRGAQAVVTGITGEKASLLRLPYSSTTDAVDDDLWSSTQVAAGLGYLTVYSSLDGEDWRRAGADAIDANLAPAGSEGQIALLHDGGGERSDTVAALDAALTRFDTEGFRVTSVGGALGITTMTPASWQERAGGAALVGVATLSHWLIMLLFVALAAAGVVTLARAALVMAFAARHSRQFRRSRDPALGRHRVGALSHRAPLRTVSVTVPAYNESAGIEASVRSIAASTHPVEIIVVDDGSTDGTADIAEGLGLPEVVVVRKANGGKPSALNAGLARASSDLVVMVDGDTVFEPDTVDKLIRPFDDPRVGAVSGNTKIANRGGILGAWQHIEYVVGFNLDRRLFDLAECMPTVPGAIGGFRREALRRVGDVSEDTLAEDTDLTMALCRDGWRVLYVEDARAWTEAPASLGALWKQRYRWCYGTMQAMWKHRRAVVQGGQSGKLGRRGLPYLLVLQVLLPLFAPVVDVFAVYGLLFLDPVRIIVAWFGFLLVQLLMALYAFRLDREPLAPLWTLPLQQLVYRQLMYLVVIQSVATALSGVRLRWQRMERYGSLRVPTGHEAEGSVRV